jgi:predicted O-methyltransferase YrrM
MITASPVTEYLATLRQLPHPLLQEIAEEGGREHLPIVDPQTGALLHALALCLNATRILEIGTAIGYSTLWMASAVPEDAMIITLERDARRAARAREHFDRAGCGRRVSVMVGDAGRYLHKIAGPFDLIFQDGDKTQYEAMLPRLAALLRRGGVLVTDNTLWNGEVIPGFVASPIHDAAATQAVAAYNRRLAAEASLSTVFLPVGDGVGLSVKR